MGVGRHGDLEQLPSERIQRTSPVPPHTRLHLRMKLFTAHVASSLAHHATAIAVAVAIAIAIAVAIAIAIAVAVAIAIAVAVALAPASTIAAGPWRGQPTRWEVLTVMVVVVVVVVRGGGV